MRKITAFLILVFSILSLYSESFTDDFLRVSEHPYVHSSGGAFASDTTLSWQVFGNPSAIRGNLITLTHSSLWEGLVNSSAISYSRVLGTKTILGAGLIVQGGDGIPVTQYPDSTSSTNFPERPVKTAR
jgi:hypothetical protein